MFAGIEAPRIALEPLGWRCVWENEIDKNCCKLLRKHYGDKTLVEGDIRNVDAKTIPSHTLLIAGFPCQSFSAEGSRKGLTENRGTLFSHIARIARIKRPEFLLLENVKGLISHDSGRTFAIILRTLGELGYLLEWQVLNSRHFGVPQQRERVFIVGHLRNKPSRLVFPQFFPQLILGNSKEERYENHCGKTVSPKGFAGTITANYGKLSGCSTKVISEDGQKRVLSPIKCERLQGFPDNYTEGFSFNNRYHMLGNSMTTNVIKWLGIQIMALMPLEVSQ